MDLDVENKAKTGQDAVGFITGSGSRMSFCLSSEKPVAASSVTTTAHSGFFLKHDSENVLDAHLWTSTQPCSNKATLNRKRSGPERTNTII